MYAECVHNTVEIQRILVDVHSEIMQITLDPIWILCGWNPSSLYSLKWLFVWGSDISATVTKRNNLNLFRKPPHLCDLWPLPWMTALNSLWLQLIKDTKRRRTPALSAETPTDPQRRSSGCWRAPPPPTHSTCLLCSGSTAPRHVSWRPVWLYQNAWWDLLQGASRAPPTLQTGRIKQVTSHWWRLFVFLISWRLSFL